MGRVESQLYPLVETAFKNHGYRLHQQLLYLPIRDENVNHRTADLVCVKRGDLFVCEFKVGDFYTTVLQALAHIGYCNRVCIVMPVKHAIVAAKLELVKRAGVGVVGIDGIVLWALAEPLRYEIRYHALELAVEGDIL